MLGQLELKFELERICCGACRAREEVRQRTPRMSQWLLNMVLVVIGLALLTLGSRWLISGAVAVAEALGVSKLVIALTIIAAGTSLPEVATSVDRIARWEGLLFLAYYAAYTVYLILDAAQHNALSEFSAMMKLFVIPLTLVTLGVLAVRALKIKQVPKGAGDAAQQ
jgi:hypothetical protein